MLTGLRRFFGRPTSYVDTRIVYDKDERWHSNARKVRGWRTTSTAKRQGWTGEIIECTENRFTIFYDNGVVQSYSLDAILDEDLAYIKKEDGSPWP